MTSTCGTVHSYKNKRADEQVLGQQDPQPPFNTAVAEETISWPTGQWTVSPADDKTSMGPTPRFLTAAFHSHQPLHVCQVHILHNSQFLRLGVPVGSAVQNLPAMQKMRVWVLGREDPLERGMTTHSSFLAWRIPWTEESGGLQSMELQKSWTQLSNWTAATPQPVIGSQGL